MTPAAPSAGVVVYAWADGSRLVTTPGEAVEGAYRPLATALEVALPGAGASAPVAAIDGAASAAVLAGGAAWLLVSEVVPSADGIRIGAAKATLVVHARGESAARVRELLAKAGATSVKERARAIGSSTMEFTAAFGGGAGEVGGALARVQLHQTAVMSDGSKGDLCGQVYVDLNALRRAAPDALDNTVLARVLGTWGLGNARDVMVTARVVAPADVATRDPEVALPAGTAAPEAYAGPSMVRVDVTWSARSEEPSKVGRGTLAAGYWGAGKDAGVPAGARWVAAVRADLGLWTVLALRTHAARLEAPARGAFSRDVDRWAAVHGAAMDRLARTARGWVVLWPSSDADGGVGLDWLLAASPAMSAEAFGKDAAAVLTPFAAAGVADANGVRVATLPGMVVGFAPMGGGVVGGLEFDAGSGERVRGRVGERVKPK